MQTQRRSNFHAKRKTQEARKSKRSEAEGSNVVEGANTEKHITCRWTSIHMNKLSSKNLQIASTSIQTEIEFNVREESLVQEFKESLLISKLPTPELFVFTGDTLKFTECRTTFKALWRQAVWTQHTSYSI